MKLRWLTPVVFTEKYIKPQNKAKTEALASVRAYWLPLLRVFGTLDWSSIKEELEFMPSFR